MSVISWLALGLVAGFLGSKMVNRSGSGLLLDLILGMLGAVAGGFVLDTFGAPGADGFNIYSLLVGAVCSILSLLIYHMIIRTVPARLR
jgi:uncharacterized membrane protein YeaQ/YmgE (transglycosylase-associated protein family)